MLKGIVIFYINVNSDMVDKGVTHESLIETARTTNKTQIEAVKSSGWDVVFIPCVNEANRVEKISFEV